MPQGPIATTVAKNPSNVLVPLVTDNNQNLLVSAYGSSSALNVTAATVIKSSSGILNNVIVVTAPGTSGALTFNDCATVASATTANTVYSIPYTAATAGLVVELNFPCKTGIVVSAVGGGTPQYSVSYS